MKQNFHMQFDGWRKDLVELCPSNEGSELCFQEKFFRGLLKQPSTGYDPTQAFTGFSQMVVVSISLIFKHSDKHIEYLI